MCIACTRSENYLGMHAHTVWNDYAHPNLQISALRTLTCTYLYPHFHTLLKSMVFPALQQRRRRVSSGSSDATSLTDHTVHSQDKIKTSLHSGIPAPPPAPASSAPHQHGQHGGHPRKRASSYARGVDDHYGQHGQLRGNGHGHAHGHHYGHSGSVELDDLNHPLEHSGSR